jgi:hypothetical protein
LDLLYAVILRHLAVLGSAPDSYLELTFAERSTLERVRAHATTLLPPADLKRLKWAYLPPAPNFNGCPA